MSHASPALTPPARLCLAQLIIDDGWSCSAAANMLMVAPRTAGKVGRPLTRRGPGRRDRPRLSRPKSMPTKTPPQLVKRIVRLWWCHRLGPVQIAGRQQGELNKQATPGLPTCADYKSRTSKAFVHTVIDDHSRIAYAEICTDEKADTVVGVLQRAVAWSDNHHRPHSATGALPPISRLANLTPRAQ